MSFCRSIKHSVAVTWSHLQVKVACTQDVLNVMEIGQRNRSVAETKMNERSSRSHSVLTIIVDGLNNVTGIRTHGCLHLIDLAGKLDAELLSHVVLLPERLQIQLAASRCLASRGCFH